MKYLLFTIFLFITAFGTYGETYEITSLSTPTITIGGKQLKKGGRFSDKSTIKWVDNKQSMEVKALSTGMLHRFSRKTFESKGNVLSIADYFLRTKKGSSRDVTDNIPLKKSGVSSRFPEKRIALVMGNSNYDNLWYLRNAQKDAVDISLTLEQLGFDIMELYEGNYSEMKTALNNFSSKAKNYDVALFYYAGHGVQYDGRNFLVPVERSLEMKSELRECLDCEDVLDRMDATGVPARIIFLDACRNVKRSWSRSSEKGLARMEGSIGSVIVFATQSGQEADDGDGDNSPFALSVIKNIQKKGTPFHETMVNLVRDTYELTNHRQAPLSIGTLLTDFRFMPESQVSAVTKQNNVSFEHGNVNASYEKGESLYIKKEYDEAFKYFKEAADAGHADAQNYVGIMYLKGRGVTKDLNKGLQYYKLSANQGNQYACANLGDIYFGGIGVTKNYPEAFKLFEKAAKQGNAYSQNKLGYMYINGLGVAKNQEKAMEWYLKAGGNGNLDAIVELGLIYENGEIVKQDYSIAKEYYEIAAERGNVVAQNLLGCLYYDGNGVEKDYAEAKRYFLMGSKNNNASATFNMGLIYEYGRGVPQDIQEAKRWYKRAESLGSKSAKNKLSEPKFAGTTNGNKNNVGTNSNNTLTGSVVDKDNEPIIGATLMIKGHNTGTATDIDGNFILENIPFNSIIEVSFVGCKTVQYSYPKDFKSKTVKITLEEK